MKLINITEAEFDALDGAHQIIVHDWARRHAVLDLGAGGRYGLSWRSDLIEPVLEASSDGTIIWLGVDQHVVAVESATGCIRLSFPLWANLLQIQLCPGLVVVLTDAVAEVFNEDCSYCHSIHLPHLPITVECQAGSYFIRLDSGERIRL